MTAGFMELEQLRQLMKIAELANFTRAAEAVGLSQPALSRSIARLEEELGQPVFERQSRQVILTDAGRLLHDRAQRIVALVDDAKAEISDDGQTGRVRVGAIPTIAPYYLPELLRRFRSDFPRATVVVDEEETANLVHKLANGALDMALLVRPVEAKYLRIDDLFEEELLLVISPDHPLRAKRHIRLADIESYPFVLLNEAHCLTENVLSFCRHHAVNPVSIEQTSQLATVQELVSLNHGISLIPRMASTLDTSDRRIYRSLYGIKPTRRVVVAWNPYRFQSRLVETFRERLKQVARTKAEFAGEKVRRKKAGAGGR